MAEIVQIDHTADMGIQVSAPTLKEAFESCAFAMFSLMVRIEKVQGKEELEVEVSADSYEDLLISWLNRLLYLHETEKLLFSRFEILDLDRSHLKARVYGDFTRNYQEDLGRAVKAATHHLVKVECDGTGEKNLCRAQVIFDV